MIVNKMIMTMTMMMTMMTIMMTMMMMTMMTMTMLTLLMTVPWHHAHALELPFLALELGTGLVGLHVTDLAAALQIQVRLQLLLLAALLGAQLLLLLVPLDPPELFLDPLFSFFISSFTWSSIVAN